MKITKIRLRQIIKEELEHAMSEQRPPMPPPPPRSKTKDAGIEQAKTYNRFAKILEKVIVKGLGDLGSDENEVIRATKFFLSRASGKRVPGRGGQASLTKFLDSMSEREATDLLRKTYALAAKNMKKYTEARKVQKAELEKTRAQPAGKGGVRSRKLSPDEIEASEKASQQMRDIK
jgi:hypothetical protein